MYTQSLCQKLIPCTTPSWIQLHFPMKMLLFILIGPIIWNSTCRISAKNLCSSPPFSWNLDSKYSLYEGGILHRHWRDHFGLFPQKKLPKSFIGFVFVTNNLLVCLYFWAMVLITALNGLGILVKKIEKEGCLMNSHFFFYASAHVVKFGL